MYREKCGDVINYLIYLEEVLVQLGSWTEVGESPYCLTHCDKYHLVKNVLPRLQQQRALLQRIQEEIPDDGF